MFGFINIGANWDMINQTSFDLFKNKIPTYSKKISLGKNVLNLKSQFNFSDIKEKKINKLRHVTNNENFVSLVQKIKTRDAFLKFCNNNREHISYNLLYRLTALKLKTSQDIENNLEESLNDFRKKIQESILIIDQPFSQSLILAEKKIKESIKNIDDVSFVMENIGENRIDVSCFWIVLNSAIIAWERKNKVKNDKNEVYDDLIAIKNIISKNPGYEKNLPLELKYIDKAIQSKDKDSISEIFDISLLEGMKLLICHIEKLPSSSYGPMLNEVYKIYEINYRKLFKSSNQELRDYNIQFKPSKIEKLSKIADIKKTS
jgi:hypothetical protein